MSEDIACQSVLLSAHETIFVFMLLIIFILCLVFLLLWKIK